MINRQDVGGFLGADAEITQISNNRFVVNFRIASSHRHLGKDEQVVEHTEWFSVRFYCSEKAAAYFEQRLRKGALVYVSGRTKTDHFTGRDGSPSHKTYVEAEPSTVQILREAAVRTTHPAQAQEHVDEHSDFHPPEPQPRTPLRTRAPAAEKPPQRPARAQAPASVNRVDLMNF